MDIIYDEENDVGYIHIQYPKIMGGLSTIPSKDDLFNFDYNGDGELIGIEFMSLEELIRIIQTNVELDM